MPRFYVLIVAAVAVLGAGAGLVYAQSRGPAPGDPRPLPDFALVGAHDMERAFGELLDRAGMPARTLPTAPVGAALWVIALERGPDSGRQLGATVVLDYYNSDSALPKDLAELAGYEGVRIQVIYRGMPGAPGAPSQVLTMHGDRDVQVVRDDAASARSYYVTHSGETIEVRVWNRSGGALPSDDDMRPLLETV